MKSRVAPTMQSFSRICAALLTVTVSALACSFGAAREALAAESVPVVKTVAGSVEGLHAEGVPNVLLYRGIPFAAPPVGALRWREPQPPAHWSGVRKSLAAVPACMQQAPSVTLPWTAEFNHQGPISEDCLYLDVWVPVRSDDRPRAVMVQIYGGGFLGGSISVPLNDGAALAHKGVIVVAANYRLGVFGFLAHPELTAESPHKASGNYGLLDQVAALRWVNENIAAFGGDPDRVTVFGGSAGAISAFLLTASPLAKGLFQRAIISSGPGALAHLGLSSVSAMSQMTPPREELERSGEKFAAACGANSIADLRTVDAQRLLSQPAATSFPPVFGPSVDGWLLPEDAATIYTKHQQNDMPIIIGTIADEASVEPGYNGTRAAELREMSIAGIDRVLAERAAAGSRFAYAYYFERAIPWPEHPNFGAFHGGDTPYVLDNLRLLNRPWTKADRTLASVASSYWANFAATGNPNGKGMPEWNPYRPGSRTFMVLGEKIEERSLTQ